MKYDLQPDVACRVCMDLVEVNGESCQACCPHDDLDCGHCIECGSDRTEDLIARAEHYADRQYDR